MDRRLIAILGLVVLGLIGLFIFTQNKAAAPTLASNAKASNHIKGKVDSRVKLLIYSDFQCSACYRFYPIESQVINKYIDKISVQFRHFPIESSHPNARAASRAAEAAGLQGKFFEMHNELFDNYSSWTNSNNPLSVFTELAKKMGLDVKRFKTDFASESVNNTISADKKAGEDVGIDGTPTYFLNNKKLDNGDIATVEQFSAVIEKAIEKSK